jgi:3-(3-hydroxy-phenyl)propionate hydroxylase
MTANRQDPATYDVVVVGYGPSGGTLANYLAQEGLSVAIVDKRAEIWPLPRAGHVDDEIVRLWQGMGLADELVPLLTDCPAYEFFTSDWRRYFKFDMPEGISDQGWRHHYFFNQPLFERTLRGANERFPNVTALLGQDVTNIEDTGSAVLVHLESATGAASVLQASYVAAFDGASSSTRVHLGVPLVEYDDGQEWLIVMVRVSDAADSTLPTDCFEWAGEERGVTFITPLPDNIRLWEFQVLPGEDRRELEQPDRVWKLLSPWITPDQGDLVRADVYTFRSVIAERWRVGRTFLGGDAAHQMPPKAGEGLCSGFRDAVNLAWKLAAVVKGGAPDSLLDTYESERQPNCLAYVEISRFLSELIVTAAREGGPPEELSAGEPMPPLGPGLHGERARPAGTRSRQPRLADGRLLDDAVGYRFAVVGEPALVGKVSEATRDSWREIGAVVVAETSPEIEAWLSELAAGAIIVRPDRFVFDAAATAQELDQLTAELAARLGVGTDQLTKESS